MRQLAATLLVMATLVLAGCSGGSGGDKQATSGAPAPPPAPTDDTGTISGTITNDEAKPVARARVAILETANETLTDEAGAFTFNGLAPGTYRLVTEALGYASAARNVDVKAGEVTELLFSLQPIVVGAEPYFEMVPFTGIIQCSVNPLYAINPCDGVTGPDKTQFKFELSKDRQWKEGVFELVWTPATAVTAQELELDVCDETADNNPKVVCINYDQFYAYETDSSPVVIRADDMPVKTVSKYIVGAGGGLASPFPTYQQSFTIYMTHCYIEACADDYTALPA